MHIYFLNEISVNNTAPFTDCIIKINNTRIDNAKDTDIVMPMYNLMKYSDNYSKPSRSLWQYCKDFNGTNATDSFNLKTKTTTQTYNNGRIDNIEIMVALKYLSNFGKSLAMPLINFKINLVLTWSADCVIIYNYVATQIPHLQ